MKILILFLIQVLLVLSQDVKVAVEEKAEIITEATWCFIGTVATYPPRPVKCLKANEIFACAYGEANCAGFGYCGTPPCTWRCWCKNGYKRDSAGNCVKFCAIIVKELPMEVA